MKPADRWVWIWNNMPEIGVDVLNSEFVDKYLEATGAKFRLQLIGAHSCPQLGQDLGAMYRAGFLRRGTLGLPGVGCNFPRWIYVYSKRPGPGPAGVSQ